MNIVAQNKALQPIANAPAELGYMDSPDCQAPAIMTSCLKTAALHSVYFLSGFHSDQDEYTLLETCLIR